MLEPDRIAVNTATLREQWTLRDCIEGCARHGVAGIAPWRDKLAECGVTEAAAICLYLAEAFPQAGLAPRTLAEKADCLRWTFFSAGPVEQAVTSRAMKWDEGLDAKKSASLGFGTYDAVVDTLAGWLSGRAYVCGDIFTAADVYVGAQVDWGLRFGTLASRPSFEAYAGRLRGRAAYKAAKEIDAAHIAAMEAAEGG